MFRIYYHDQPPYDGDPFYAPIWGVLVIVENDPDSGRRLVQNGDYYVWEGRWWPVDFAGLLDYLARPGPRRVLIGRLVGDDDFRKTYIAADNDPDFRPRTNSGRLGSKVR